MMLFPFQINQFYFTFCSGHFLLVMCAPYGIIPPTISEDLYQFLNSCSGTSQGLFGLAGTPLISANLPVEVTSFTSLSYSSQSLAIFSLSAIFWMYGSGDCPKNCLYISLPGPKNGVMSLLIKSFGVSTGSS